MDPAQHLATIRTETARVAALPIDSLEATVPALPDWTVERVVRHLGKVHQWVAGVLRLPAGASMDQVDTATLAGIPKGPACLEAYAASADDLIAAFEARDPGDPIATFVGDEHVRWWLRRQAHEVTVHRADAHDAVAAAGGAAPDPIEADIAADGIDEWARVFLSTRFAQRFGAFPADLAGRSIHLHGTDDPAPPDGAEWIIRFAEDPEGGVAVEAEHAKGDAAVRGPAADLLLALWNRRPLDSVDIVGDRAVVTRLLEVATF